MVPPPSGLVSAQILPPWAATIEWQIDNPTPMPVDLVVTKGLNSSAVTSAGSPGPVSATLISMKPSGHCRVDTVSSRRSQAAIASIAFRMRFTSTCWIWMRSITTSGAPIDQAPDCRGLCS